MADLGTISILIDVRGQPIVKELATDLSNVAKEEVKVSAATQRVMADFKRMQQITAMLKKDTDAAAASFQRFSAKELQQASQRMQGFESSLANTRRGMGQMGMATQQVGYQVGDFLVQIQSGTSAFVAFGQQATQLVGILPAFSGVLGMSVGSLIALSSGLGIAIPLLTAIGAVFMRTSEESNTATQAVDKQKQAYEALVAVVEDLRLKREMLQSGAGSEQEQNALNAIYQLELKRSVLQQEAEELQRRINEGVDTGLDYKMQEIQAAIKANEEEKARFETILRISEEEAARLAAIEAQERALVNSYEVYARTRSEAAQIADQVALIESGMSQAAVDGLILAGLDLSNLSSAADEVARLATNMGVAVSQAANLLLEQGRLDRLNQNAGRGATSSRPLEWGTGELVKLEVATKKAAGGSRKLKEGLDEAAKAAEALRKQLDQPLVSAIGSVSNAFGDFIARGLSDFKGFVKSILGSFQNMIAQMIAMAVKNRIMLSLGIGGITPGMAAAGQVAGLGSAGGMLGSLGIGQGMAGLAGGTGFLGGMGNAVSGLAGGGAGFLGIGGNAAMAGGGALATIGAAIPPLLAVAAVFSFFKKKTKELDSGLRVTVDNMGTLVETFKTVQTSRFFGLSKKTTTTATGASAEISDPIVGAVSAIQSDILKMAGVLSIGSDAFKDFAYQLDISLKGLTEEQAAAKVQEELLKVGDAMADLIPNLSAFKQGAETSAQTLTRLYSSLQVANNAFGQLIGTMFEASLAGASLASNLISAFGSVDAFNNSMSTFTQNFYSEAEQVTMASNRVSQAFAALGIAAPATAAAFRALVEGLMRDATAGVAGAATQLAGVLATQQDIITVNAYNEAQARAAAEARAAAQAAAARAAAEAQRAADEAQKEAQQKAERIAQERYSLETQLLQLQGNTTELRRRELALLDPTNRALQEMVWNLEDAKNAMEDISEVDFATKVDFLRAVGLARNNIPGFAAGGMFNGGPRIVGESGPELEVTGPSRIYSNRDTASMFRDPELAGAVDGLRREVSGMRSEQLQIQVEISKNVKRVYDIERKWDTDGLPPERV